MVKDERADKFITMLEWITMLGRNRTGNAYYNKYGEKEKVFHGG